MSLSPLYKRTLQFTDLNDQAKLFRYLIFCDFLFLRRNQFVYSVGK